MISNNSIIYNDRRRLNEWYLKRYTRRFLLFKWVKKVDAFTILYDLQKEMEQKRESGASESELIKYRGMIISIV